MNQMRFAIKRLVALTVTLCCLAASASDAADGDAFFEKEIRPLVERYCNDCHSGVTTQADIDLGAVATHADVRRPVDVWLTVRTRLDSRQMPPKIGCKALTDPKK